MGTAWRWTCLVAAFAVAASIPLLTGAPPAARGEELPLSEKLEQDTLTMDGGVELKGKILEMSRSRVAILLDGERKTFQRKHITDLDRSKFTTKVSDYFKKKFGEYAEDGAAEQWRELADLCIAREASRGLNLTPERNRALRSLLKLSPDDAQAKKELRYAVYHDGRWHAVDEVAGLAAGGGKSKKTSTSVKKKTKPKKDPYVFTAGKSLSERELKRLEDEIANWSKIAGKVRERREIEYEGVEWEDRHKIRSKHFEVQCNSTKRIAVLYSRIMELIRFELSKKFKSPTLRANLRAPVFIYKSQENFIETDRLGPYGGRGLGGYYHPVSQQISAFHGTFGFTATTFGVLAHEGTHYYQGQVLKSFRNVPIWLIEGLAVYFGDGSKFDAEKVKITTGLMPRDRLVHIQEKMEADRHTKVYELVGMKRGWGGFSGSHYADAWALIYFLVNSGKDGENLLRAYWVTGMERELKKKDFKLLAEKYFGSIKELDAQYMKYILALPLPSAGEVVGDYFKTETFRFLVKRPGPEWKFFEDRSDKKVLIGMAREGEQAEIRVYYENNMTEGWQEGEDFVRGRKKVLEASHGSVRMKEVVMAGLPAFELRYSTDGTERSGISGIVIGSDGRVEIQGESKKKGGWKNRRPGPRDVLEYVLAQKDGIAWLECSAPKGQGKKYVAAFQAALKSFTLDPTRRW